MTTLAFLKERNQMLFVARKNQNIFFSSYYVWAERFRFIHYKSSQASLRGPMRKGTKCFCWPLDGGMEVKSVETHVHWVIV